MPSDIDFIKAKMSAFKTNLEGSSGRDKGKHVSKHVCEQFNSMLDEIGQKHPEAKEHLPKPISLTGHAAKMMGISDITFLDLEIMVDMVLNILSVLETGR